MDLGIIITVVGASLANIGVLISVMFWTRQEANSVRAEMKEDRKDMLQISRNLETAIQAIHAEVKDFHARMCAIGEKRQR